MIEANPSLEDQKQILDNFTKICQYKCSIHPEESASYICTYQDCINNYKSFLCQNCLELHDKNHKNEKYLEEIHNFFSINHLEGVKLLLQEEELKFLKDPKFLETNLQITDMFDHFETKMVSLLKEFRKKSEISLKRSLYKQHLENDQITISDYEKVLINLFARDTIPDLKTLLTVYADHYRKLTHVIESHYNSKPAQELCENEITNTLSISVNKLENEFKHITQFMKQELQNLQQDFLLMRRIFFKNVNDIPSCTVQKPALNFGEYFGGTKDLFVLKYSNATNHSLEMQKYLESGSFYNLYLGLDPNIQAHCIVKVLDVDYLKTIFKDESVILNMINIEMRLNHKNIVNMHKVHRSEHKLYAIMDYCNEGNLSEHIKKFPKGLPVQLATILFIQIINAFKYLNELQIVHRNIKPINIFMHNGEVKLTDFMLAKYIQNESILFDGRAATHYLPPSLARIQEKYLYDSDPAIQEYPEKQDIWAVGLIYLEMLTGITPFWGHEEFFKASSSSSLAESIEEMSIINLLKNEDIINEDKYKEINPQAIDLLLRMLDIKEEKRISWKEVFLHPFIIATNV